MPLLFWLDVGALGISAVLAASLALAVVGFGPGRTLNRLFAIFALAEAAWAIFSLLLRLALWLERGSPLLLLELLALAFVAMGPLLLMFTVRYVGRRIRRADLVATLGLAALAALSVPLFRHQIIFNPHLAANGMVVSDLGAWGFVAALLPILYLAWSLLLFWQERHRTGESYLALSVLILLAGFIADGVLNVPLPILSVTTTISVAALGYGIASQQLLNPLRELTEELERKVEERTRESEKARAEVEERVEERTAKLKREISERERVEEALRDSEERYRALYEDNPSMYFTMDAEGTVLSVNRFGAEQLGYTVEELVGQSVLNVFHDDDKAAVQQHLAMCLQNSTQVARWEFRKVRKDGSILWVKEAVRAVRGSDGYPVVLVVCEDITARKRAEGERERLLAALQRRSAQLQTAAEVSRAASSILDPHKLIQRVVGLVRERFDLYYAGLFLVGQTGEWAVLWAGTGEAGRRMLEQGHRLEIGGTSMIGWCVANGQARIALDVGEEVVRFENPHLPETRSELALPLISRGQVIGALTIQSSQEAAFSKEDIAALQAMADQLANAIQNARLYAETRRRLQEQIALREAGATISSTLDQEVVLNRIAEQMAQALDTTSAYISIFEPEIVYESGSISELETVSSTVLAEHIAPQSCSQERLSDLRSTYVENDVEFLKALQAGKTDIAHVTDPDLVESDLLHMQLYGAQTILYIPLLIRGRLIGFAELWESRRRRDFTTEEIALCQGIAQQAAIAIENARLFKEARQRAERLAVVNRVARAVSGTLELDELIETVYREVTSVFQADAFFIALCDAETDELDFRIQVDEGVHEPPGRYPLGSGLTSVVITERKPLLVRDLEQERDRLPAPEAWGTMKLPASWLGVPMLIGERVIGVICVQAYYSSAYGEEEQLLLSTIADEVAVAVEKARLYEQAQQETAERKQAEEALRKSEEKYRTILENIEDGYYEVDVAGNYMFFNDALCRIIGYPEEELLGMNNRQYMDAEVAKIVFQTFNTVYRTGEPTEAFDWEVIRKDGTRRHIELSVSLIRDSVGQPSGFRGIVRDITERKRAEGALRESEERYRTLVTQAPIGVITCDRTGDITHVNPALLEIIGFSGDGDDPPSNLLTMPDLIEAGIAADVRYCMEEGVQVTTERLYRSQWGKESIVRLHLAPLRDESDAVGGVLGTIEDVTEARRLQEQLAQSAKLASIGGLAAGVAHEINNPINGIINYAQLLLNKIEAEGRQAPRTRKWLEGILREGDRVASIVRDLLTFARVEKSAHSPAHVSDILRATLTLTGQLLEKDGIILEIEEQPDLPQIKCRSQRIQQVFLNLISNARDALNARYPGSDPNKRLTIRLEPVERAGQLYVRATFHDRGAGIPAGNLSHIFTPFFTTKRPVEGTGLGLSVSYGIVQDHHGDIQVESVEGEYTIFRVDLPVDPGWEM